MKMADTPVASDYTPTDVFWLPEDLTGEKSSNWIVGEKHPVVSLNMSDQRLILTPFYGAFYYDNYPLTSYVSDVDPDTHIANPETHQETDSNAIPNLHLTIKLVKKNFMDNQFDFFCFRKKKKQKIVYCCAECGLPFCYIPFFCNKCNLLNIDNTFLQLLLRAKNENDIKIKNKNENRIRCFPYKFRFYYEQYLLKYIFTYLFI